MGCKVAVVGYNFRFGKNAKGDADALCKLMGECGGKGVMREELKSDGQTVSATAIRALLEKGKIEEANRLLGKPYRLFSTVEHGNGMGKSFGYPTINTKIETWRIPLRRGVYRTAVRIKNQVYPGLTNIGVCPTFEERELHAETYILDFSGDLYGERAEIFLLEFMRDEIRFESEKELIMQINIDKKQAIKKNGEEKWQELGLK
jgi:riboflavin kinase/FMN adenylyltransferase